MFEGELEVRQLSCLFHNISYDILILFQILERMLIMVESGRSYSRFPFIIQQTSRDEVDDCLTAVPKASTVSFLLYNVLSFPFHDSLAPVGCYLPWTLYDKGPFTRFHHSCLLQTHP